MFLLMKFFALSDDHESETKTMPTHQEIIARLTVRASGKTFHQLFYGASVLHRLDINIRFWKPFWRQTIQFCGKIIRNNFLTAADIVCDTKNSLLRCQIGSYVSGRLCDAEPSFHLSLKKISNHDLKFWTVRKKTFETSSPKKTYEIEAYLLGTIKLLTVTAQDKAKLTKFRDSHKTP